MIRILDEYRDVKKDSLGIFRLRQQDDYYFFVSGFSRATREPAHNMVLND